MQGGASHRHALSVTRRVRLLFEGTTLRQDMQNEAVFAQEDYSRIDCPVLGIYGDRSDLYWVTEELPGLIRDLTLHTVAGADHLGVFARLEEFRPLICDFLGLPARAAVGAGEAARAAVGAGEAARAAVGS
jgi:pimeloyl-ACP methyl ester carboxylesterase